MKSQQTQDKSKLTTPTHRIDTGAEDKYWNSAYETEPYFNKKYDFNDYSPAYKLGYEGRLRYLGSTFNEVEDDLASDWENLKGKSRLMWNDAKQAVRAGWHRIERALPGDADNDGR